MFLANRSLRLGTVSNKFTKFTRQSLFAKQNRKMGIFVPTVKPESCTRNQIDLGFSKITTLFRLSWGLTMSAAKIYQTKNKHYLRYLRPSGVPPRALFTYLFMNVRPEWLPIPNWTDCLAARCCFGDGVAPVCSDNRGPVRSPLVIKTYIPSSSSSGSGATTLSLDAKCCLVSVRARTTRYISCRSCCATAAGM